MRIAIYTRSATKHTEEQIEALNRYCHMHDWSVSKTYSDEGCSGANTDRPALQEMMSDVRAGKIDRVLVYGVDRLSRSPQTALQLIDEIMENGSALISPINDFDTSTPSGKLKLNILKGFALR